MQASLQFAAQFAQFGDAGFDQVQLVLQQLADRAVRVRGIPQPGHAVADFAQAEAQATSEVRSAAANAGLRAAEVILRERTQGEAAEAMVRSGISQIRGAFTH